MKNWEAFKTHLKQQYQQGLPGEIAHIKLAPEGRLTPDQYQGKLETAKQSAVLLLFYPKENSPQLIFIKRASYHGTHGGQMAFPGGKKEIEDSSNLHTALRETEEEIGINATNISVLGPLSSLYIPPSNFQVHPFIGWVEQEPLFSPDPREVEEVCSFSVNTLLNPNALTRKKIQTSTIKIETPCYKIGQTIIWGASAMMLSELLMILNKKAV